jgi:helix-turn-helix protein
VSKSKTVLPLPAQNDGSPQPVEAGKNLKPEWLRINAAIQIFGLSRSKLYELIADRKIKSFCLRERNRIEGVRLISFDSLSEFLEKEAKKEGNV